MHLLHDSFLPPFLSHLALSFTRHFCSNYFCFTRSSTRPKSQGNAPLPPASSKMITSRRLLPYGAASTALAAWTVIHALNNRPNFYSAAVYLSSSNACVLVRLTHLHLSPPDRLLTRSWSYRFCPTLAFSWLRVSPSLSSGFSLADLPSSKSRCVASSVAVRT